MSSITLYTNPMSRGRIARWMLEEAGVDYDVHLVKFGGEDPALKALNPLGKVPTLEHDGRVITECAAICAYVADAFPEAGLAPAPADRADYYRWLFFAAGPLETAIVNRSLGVTVPAERRGMVGYREVETMVDTLVVALDGKEFIAGERFSAADVYVGSHIGWGLQFGTIPARPELQTYWNQLRERQACGRANEKDDALLPAAKQT